MRVRYEAGFSLLELLVVITIIGILAASAGPGYSAMTRSGRLNEGKHDLYRIMAQQQRHFLLHYRYTLTLGNRGLGYSSNADGSVRSPNGYFTTQAGPCTINTVLQTVVSHCIRLTATGQNRDAGYVYWLQSNGDSNF